jgi:hypothetical protein
MQIQADTFPAPHRVVISPMQVDISSFPAGVYIVMLESAGKVLGRKKLVVIR